MKKRTGFVSNSSSSSFTCDFCGETESGMDWSIQEAGMVDCVNDHRLCKGHLIGEVRGLTYEEMMRLLVEQTRDNIKFWDEHTDYRGAQEYADEAREELRKLLSISDLEEYFEDGDGFDWWEDYQHEIGVSSGNCPLCQFQSMTSKDLARFTLHELGWSKEYAIGQAKETYGTYEKFAEAMKGEG